MQLGGLFNWRGGFGARLHLLRHPDDARVVGSVMRRFFYHSYNQPPLEMGFFVYPLWSYCYEGSLHECHWWPVLLWSLETGAPEEASRVAPFALLTEHFEPSVQISCRNHFGVPYANVWGCMSVKTRSASEQRVILFVSFFLRLLRR